MTEFAIVAPVMILFVLLLFQFALIIQAHWTVDQAAIYACRAEIVRVDDHPNPEVAAQITMIPVTTATFIRGVDTINTGSKYLNMPFEYAAAIAKTETSVSSVGQQRFVTAEVAYAFELTIPLAGNVFVKTHQLLEFAKRHIEDNYKNDTSLNMADKWSALTGRPHLLLKREASLKY